MSDLGDAVAMINRLQDRIDELEDELRGRDAELDQLVEHSCEIEANLLKQIAELEAKLYQAELGCESYREFADKLRIQRDELEAKIQRMREALRSCMDWNTVDPPPEMFAAWSAACGDAQPESPDDVARRVRKQINGVIDSIPDLVKALIGDDAEGAG